MTYRFKPLDELYWGVTIASALVLLQGLVTLDPAAVTDWQTWAVALGGGAIRAAAGATLDYIRRSMTSEPETASPSAIPIFHQRCNGVAFISLVEPVEGRLPRADQAIHVNGRPMVVGEPSRCDSCALPIGVPRIIDGYWVVDMPPPPAPAGFDPHVDMRVG